MAKLYEICSQRGCKNECEHKCDIYCTKCTDFEFEQLDFSSFDCMIEVELLQEEMRGLYE